MFENHRRGRQARNFTTNVPKILHLKSSSEQKFFRKLSLGAPVTSYGTDENKRALKRVCVNITWLYYDDDDDDFFLITNDTGKSKL